MSAFLSHKFGLIFPHVPRTGGTSLTDAVSKHLGGKDITDGQLEKHQSLRIIQIGFPKEFARYVKFAVVRHPFDRFASLHQGYSPKCSLESMIDQVYSGAGEINIRTYAFYWPMKQWLCDDNGQMLCDKVFRFEDDFPDEVVQFLNTVNIPIEKLQHVNKGPGGGKKGFYYLARKACSPETMAKFRELYAWDYERFGYK